MCLSLWVPALVQSSLGSRGFRRLRYGAVLSGHSSGKKSLSNAWLEQLGVETHVCKLSTLGPEARESNWAINSVFLNLLSGKLAFRTQGLDCLAELKSWIGSVSWICVSHRWQTQGLDHWEEQKLQQRPIGDDSAPSDCLNSFAVTDGDINLRTPVSP